MCSLKICKSNKSLFELPYCCIESAPGDVVLGEDGKPIEGAVPPQIGEDGQPIVGAAAGTEAAEAPAPEPEVKETHPCLKLTFFFYIYANIGYNIWYSLQSRKVHHHHLNLNWICHRKVLRYHL